jgi:hypothetical protein
MAIVLVSFIILSPAVGGQSARAARSFPEPQYAQKPFSVPARQQP